MAALRAAIQWPSHPVGSFLSFRSSYLVRVVAAEWRMEYVVNPVGG